MREYEAVIGLEVHAELSTESKIYCGCRNEFGAEPNTNCCPVCMGMPGTLPVLNRKVVEYAVKMGCALNCHINSLSRQDRKNYFYPDLPKAYQISQSDIPVCANGYLDIFVNGETKRVGITRIHIEEDAGKLIHDALESGTMIDYNRCGVPLIEIVTEPDMHSANEARAFLENIRSILRYLDISDCKMQEGSIRCDVNVSIREKGSSTNGTRCEMKNVNSFSAVVRAIEYEIMRQIKIVESGDVIRQETRKWDDLRGTSILLRSKEDAQDYRFFPEPDLGSIVLQQEEIDMIRSSVPELPEEKITRYITEYGLSRTEAELIAYDTDKVMLFEDAVAAKECVAKSVCNWILGDISKLANERGESIQELKIRPGDLAKLISLIEKAVISNSSAKQVLELMISTQKTPEIIVKENNFTQISDENTLILLINRVIDENQKSVSDYKNGKKNAFGYLVGQCMKASKGQGNPAKINELLKQALM